MKSIALRQFAILVVLCSLGSHPLAANEGWVTYDNCRLLPNLANDGDSFHVRADGREYIFRLYFVDTPETEANFPQRVAQQARYFAVTVPQVLQIGKEAERFTRAKLTRPFSIITRKQDARGESRLRRYFAFVEIDHADLAEELVAHGLARIYGATAQAPTTKEASTEEGKLRQLEAAARAQRRGGGRVGTATSAPHLSASASTDTPAPETDSFAAFFHPPAPAPALSPTERKPVPGAKLDINTASSEALQTLSGIGPVLAARIIAARPFKSADELARVSGVGDKKYASLRPHFL